MENQSQQSGEPQESNVEEFKAKVSSGEVELGNGAQFWAYISPSNDTAKYVTDWTVRLEQQNGNWTGEITSKNPYQNLQTPGLSGVFTVTVTASGPNMPETELQPKPGTQPNVGCNSNCAAMIGIVAAPGGASANYWTVWDAYCKQSAED